MPGKDFYDWQNRCISTGDIYNPNKLYFDESSLDTMCPFDISAACMVGDLHNKIGTIDIAGSKNTKMISRKLFTISDIPLSGNQKVLEKSVVIYDDYGPKARGNRLACSM